MFRHVLPCQLQPDQRQQRVHVVEGGHVLRDQGRETAGAHDHGVGNVPFRSHPLDHPRDCVHGGEEDAGVDAGFGSFADDLSRGDELDGRKLGGPGREPLLAGHEPRGDDAALEAPVGGDAVVGSGGAQIDDDAVAPEEAGGRHGIGDSVGAHRARFLHVEDDRQRGRRVDDHELRGAQPGRGFSQDIGGGRNHRAQHHACEGVGIVSGRAEQRAEQQHILVGGARHMGAHPPATRDPFLPGGEEGENGFGVAHIQYQMHVVVPRVVSGDARPGAENGASRVGDVGVRPWTNGPLPGGRGPDGIADTVAGGRCLNESRAFRLRVPRTGARLRS